MTEITDEMLMAYADGELDDHQSDIVEQHLSENPEARKKVGDFQRTYRLVSRAYGAPARERPPEALINAIRKNAEQSPDQHRTAAIRTKSHRLILPIAASLALVVGLLFFLPQQTFEQKDLTVGTIAESSVLAKLLEERVAGVPAALASGNVAVVTATFRDGRGRPCRELEERLDRDGQQATIAAIACRDGNATWRIEGVARLSLSNNVKRDFLSAGTRDQDPLSGVINMLKLRPAMTAQEERDWIAKRWR